MDREFIKYKKYLNAVRRALNQPIRNVQRQLPLSTSSSTRYSSVGTFSIEEGASEELQKSWWIEKTWSTRNPTVKPTQTGSNLA